MRNLTILAALWMTGCGACQQVASNRSQFLEAQSAAAPDDRPHIAIEIPEGMITGWLDSAIRSAPSAGFRIPGLGDVSRYAGDFTAKARTLRVALNKNESANFALDLDIKRNGRTLFGMDMSAVAPVKYDPKTKKLTIALRADMFEKVAPRIDAGSVDKLTNAIFGELPAAARLLLPKRAVSDLARVGIQKLTEQAYSLFRRELLTPLGELARFSFDMPDLPISGLSLDSVKGGWRLAARTPFGASGLNPASEVKTTGQRIRFQVSADALAHIGNWAMKGGKVPSRFTADGKADEKGKYDAGMSWANGGQPLKAHLWTREAAKMTENGLCLYARAGADPKISYEQGKLQVGFENGKVEEVVGPPLINQALGLMGVTEKVFDYTRSMATKTKFSMGRGAYKVEMSKAALRGNTLTLDLSVGGNSGGS